MKTVLFIDDNPDATDLFEFAARQLGITPTVCPDGATALNLLEAQEFDAVILDLSMPVLDGLTIAEEIRRNEEIRPNKKPVCIVFYTARTIDGAIQRVGQRVGVERIYQKPYDISDMLMEIKDLCGNRQMLVRTQEKGASQSNAMLCLFAVIVQIVVGCLFLWFNHRTEDWWALKWSQAVKRGDAMKIICDSNAEKKNALEIVIEQNKFNAAPELLTERPCVVEVEK